MKAQLPQIDEVAKFFRQMVDMRIFGEVNCSQSRVLKPELWRYHVEILIPQI